MKSVLLFPFALLLASCQDDQTDSAQNDSSSGSGQSTTTSSAPSEGNQKRSITPSNRRNGVEQAQIASVKTCLRHLVQACDGFFEEYQALPLASVSTIDATQQTDNLFMAALLGLRSAANENPKFIPFFTFKSTTADEKKDGLLRTENRAELFDPWGNHYRVVLNYDYDNQMKTFVTDEIIWDRRVLVWSAGPDGESGTPETNADNIYSWKTQ